MQTGKQGAPARVLLIFRQMIPSVYLCAHVQMELLAAEGRVEYRARSESELTRADMDWAQLVLLGRLDSWYAAQAAAALKRAGKWVGYILDDDLLAVPAAISSAPHYQSAEVRRQIERMIALSDAVLSPSPLLLSKYAGGKLGVLVEEPAIDPVAYEPHGRDEPVRVGFAGSVDRTSDLEAILGDALRAIKQTYGARVEFEFFGAIPDFARELDAATIPYRPSYTEYRRLLNGRRWDIGLAPMPDTPFHACKHYNKFVEYAAAGVVGVFSDVSPYDRLHGRTEAAVFCANDAGAWREAIAGLIDDGARRERLRALACADAAGMLSVRSTAEALLAQLPALGTEQRAVRFAPGLLGMVNALARAKEFAGAYGWRMPMVIAKKALARLRG